MIEQAQFLSTVFLCRKFKLENIYSGVNVCGNFYLQELLSVDCWKNCILGDPGADSGAEGKSKMGGKIRHEEK